ncbi:ATP-binding cassette domain-containing protein [Knoellia sp. 3-2P3]|uniref:ABC transporter ATP-binding protein n=1 Tax=unclassified Knoellia TaxID=2618719 RepID=UPI0023DB2768|nr:ATP-binding cassette domain-containing protein [Knoellia sp. 3-2P3]MDF2092362.1 ATP-binding cassette domain-containing protein [Knoellia sp. 3-2P3]
MSKTSVQPTQTPTPPTPADPAIRCDGLTTDYGSGRGLFDLDLSVHRGEVFGLIGPNGAGKTTMIRLLMGLIRPGRGRATLLGLDAQADSLELKRRIGYLPGGLPQFTGVTAGYVVGLMAGLRGVDPSRITALAERLELDLGQRFQSLSRGNKPKVGLVQAFMHRPELLILDEPTLGLDPLVQHEFRRLLTESAEAGATVLPSSHVLAEVERVCDRMGLIRSGRLEHGRVEVVLAAPVSWTRLVRERVLTVLVGSAVITAAGLTALVLGANRRGSRSTRRGWVASA